MRARATVRLGWTQIPANDRHAHDVSAFQYVVIEGDPADDWESAKASVVIPEGGMVVAWHQDD